MHSDPKMFVFVPPTSELTPREQQIIELILSERLTTPEIATRLGTSYATVRNQMDGLFRKLNLQDWGNPRVRLVAWACHDKRFRDIVPL